MRETAPGSPKIPFILTGITAALCIFLVLHIQSSSKNTLTKYLPWVDATAEIKLETTMAHLWFEELLSGDTDVDISRLIKHLEQAEWLTTAILDGAKTGSKSYQPLTDPTLRKHANQLLFQLMRFKNVTMKQIGLSVSENANHQDQAYDDNFWTLIEKIEDLESAIQTHIQDEKRANDSSLLLLIISIGSMAGISIFSMGRFTLNRSKYMQQLSDANKRISDQNAQLIKSSQTDQLTGLPNRQMLVTIAKQMLGYVHRKNVCMSLTFIDLDFFKPINDEYGHSVGDKVLINLTKTISAHLRDGDVLTRLAGDEFILLLQENTREELEVSLIQILNRIRICLEDPIIDSPDDIHVRFSAGTAIAPDHSMEFDELLHLADIAMYESKNQGRGMHYFYCPETITGLPDFATSADLIPEAAIE